MKPKEFDFTLPSGKIVRMRESTGLDQMAAESRFIGKPENERLMKPWEDIAKCILMLDGQPVSGYEQLLPLTNKDLAMLLFAYQQINTPTAQEVEDLKSFFASKMVSDPLLTRPVLT